MYINSSRNAVIKMSVQVPSNFQQFLNQLGNAILHILNSHPKKALVQGISFELNVQSNYFDININLNGFKYSMYKFGVNNLQQYVLLRYEGSPQNVENPSEVIYPMSVNLQDLMANILVRVQDHLNRLVSWNPLHIPSAQSQQQIISPAAQQGQFQQPVIAQNDRYFDDMHFLHEKIHEIDEVLHDLVYLYAYNREKRGPILSSLDTIKATLQST